MQTQFSVSIGSEPQNVPEINRVLGHDSRELSKDTKQTSVSPNSAMGFSSGLDTNKAGAGPNDRPDYRRVVSSESSSQRGEKEEFQDIFSELMTGTEHEIAFLIRHFTQIIAPWYVIVRYGQVQSTNNPRRLDLSDAGKFFSGLAPIRALSCLSLKFSIAALAAKQLGRVKGAKSFSEGGMFTRPATTETYPNAAQVDWYLKAANYYYLAAADLSSSTSDRYTIASSSAVLESPIEVVGRWLNKRPSQGMGQTPVDDDFLRKAEDMLASSVLLTLYRLLDAKGEEWHM